MRQIGRATDSSLNILRVTFRIGLSELSTLGIIAYFSGWWYLNTYLSTFGINRSSITSPDFTVLLYAHSAISAIPFMIFELRSAFLISLLCVALVFLGAIFTRCIPKRLPRMLLLRVWSWSFLFIAILNVSKEAGHIDSKYVLDGCGRVVEVLWNPSFNKVDDNDSETTNDQRLYKIFDASSDRMVVLLWRNSTETILFHYTGDTLPDGSFMGGEAWRIDNSMIGGIVHHVPNRDSRTLWDVLGLGRICSRRP